MSLKIAFLTYTRGDLWDVGCILAAGVESELLVQESNPILAAVRGSLLSGKSIVPDAFREFLKLNAPYLRTKDRGGLKNEDGTIPDRAMWYSGTILDKPFVFFFMDTGGEGPELPPDEKERHLHDSRYWDAFLREVKRKGGIAFVHNNRNFSQTYAGLSVWVEGESHVYRGFSRIFCGPLKEQYNKAVRTSDSDWVRYVELEIKDERLLQSPQFRQAFNEIVQKFGAVVLQQATVLAPHAPLQFRLTG